MQTILQGIQHLKTVVKGSSKVLLVCDSSFPFLSIKSDIEQLPVPYVIFNQFSPNPLYEDVCKGVELFNNEHCDTIVAVGGGSSIDVAKCIKLYCRMNPRTLFLEQPYQDTRIKLIAIPTTAGTGSESTRYAVIYYNGKKQSVTHESIIPDVAILEPKVLRTLPLYQKKCTMLDALCQGIESWWSVNSTDESKTYSKAAISLIMHHWRNYIFRNTDEAAEKIMEAANLSGKAICITQTTAAHAFSYKITSLYKLPHGNAVAVCLPEIWDFMLSHPNKCIDSRGIDYVSSTLQSIAEAIGASSPQEAISSFRAMIEEMEMGNPISETMEQDIHILSASVNPVRLKNNPIELNDEDIKSLYEKIIRTSQN